MDMVDTKMYMHGPSDPLLAYPLSVQHLNKSKT